MELKVMEMTSAYHGFMDDRSMEQVNCTGWTTLVMTVMHANIPWFRSNDWPNWNLHNTWRSVGYLLLRRWISYGFYQTAKLSQLRVGPGIPSCNWIVSEFRSGFHLLIGESSQSRLPNLTIQHSSSNIAVIIVLQLFAHIYWRVEVWRWTRSLGLRLIELLDDRWWNVDYQKDTTRWWEAHNVSDDRTGYSTSYYCRDAACIFVLRLKIIFNSVYY